MGGAQHCVLCAVCCVHVGQQHDLVYKTQVYKTSTRRYMQVQRINYLCDVAPGEEHQATQHQHDYGTSTNSTTRHVLQPYMQCRKTPREPWMDWPKVWAHADALASMVVHEGLVWPEEANSTMAPVPTSQALLVHVHNLFFDRTNQPEGDALVEDDTWLLPLRRAHEGIV